MVFQEFGGSLQREMLHCISATPNPHLGPQLRGLKKLQDGLGHGLRVTGGDHLATLGLGYQPGGIAVQRETGQHRPPGGHDA